MRGIRLSAPLVLGLAVLATPVAPQPAGAQTEGDLHLRRLLAVPLGALPPMGMLMPASRNHNYWVGRLQAGTQRNNIEGDHNTIAGGIDFQWRGGSVVGVTGGYQYVECDENLLGCGGHPLFGARARFNLLTGGPTIAALVGDNSATTTIGGELGYGYAPNAISTRNACAVDAGMPVTLSFFQRFRVLTFFTPGIAWDVRCPRAGSAGSAASTWLGAGVGIQQLGHPGLDVSLGVQRIFRQGSGTQLGINVTFVRLP